MKEVKRPWGKFKLFIQNKKCTVKIHEIKPHGKSSLQYHNNREEFWYFLEAGYYQIGIKTFHAKAGELVNIPKRKNHRWFSKGKKFRIMEIAKGNFSESDIVRSEDKYGRK